MQVWARKKKQNKTKQNHQSYFYTESSLQYMNVDVTYK